MLKVLKMPLSKNFRKIVTSDFYSEFICSPSNRLLADRTLLAVLAKPFHGTILVEMMLTWEYHDHFVRLIL